MAAGDKKAASEHYLRACAVYRIARFPYITGYPEINCPVKWKAWEAQKDVYMRAARSWDQPVKEELVPHVHRKGGDRDGIPVYVRVPSTTTASPVGHPPDGPRRLPPG